MITLYGMELSGIGEVTMKLFVDCALQMEPAKTIANVDEQNKSQTMLISYACASRQYTKCSSHSNKYTIFQTSNANQKQHFCLPTKLLQLYSTAGGTTAPLLASMGWCSLLSRRLLAVYVSKKAQWGGKSGIGNAYAAWHIGTNEVRRRLLIDI